jgi:hypothetical protein
LRLFDLSTTALNATTYSNTKVLVGYSGTCVQVNDKLACYPTANSIPGEHSFDDSITTTLARDYEGKLLGKFVM